jgi:stage II sporulation protein D
VVAAGGGIRLVNQIDVEDYLRGMGEVRDSRWPAASLQAQAVAARTYALRAMAAGGEICASQRCQVYLGQQAEYPAMDAAVAATKGQVLYHGGALASAVYSANGGGITATGKEGFGDAAGGAPYLQAQVYPTRDSDPWEVRIGLAELGSRLGYPAGLQSVAVSATGPSGRATEVELHGASGTRQVPARTFARALGLRSTLWSIGSGSAAEALPSPPAGDLFQASPEDLSDDETLTYFPPPTTAQEGPLDGSTAIAATPVSPDTPVPWGLYLGVFLVGAALRRLAYLRNLTW